MSQKKVDYYKEQKANRKETVKKEKMLFRLEIGAIVVVLAALLIWFGASVYSNAAKAAEAKRPGIKNSIYITAIDEYLADLDAYKNLEEDNSEEATEEKVEETKEAKEEEATEEEAEEEAAEDEEAEDAKE